MSNPLIIENPRRQGRLRWFVQGTLTLGLWLAWLYLLLPAVAPALAMAGADLAAMGLTVEAIDAAPFLQTLMLAAAVLVGFWLWSTYNRLLYRLRVRAQGQGRGERVGRQALADSFGICSVALDDWQHSARLVIRHTEQSAICSVDAGTQKVYPFAERGAGDGPQVQAGPAEVEMIPVSRAS